MRDESIKAHGLIRDVYPHARSFWVSVKKMWYAASLPKPMAVLLYTEIMVKTTPGVGWSTGERCTRGGGQVEAQARARAQAPWRRHALVYDAVTMQTEMRRR